jgi:hypothetical protein
MSTPQNLKLRLKKVFFAPQDQFWSVIGQQLVLHCIWRVRPVRRVKHAISGTYCCCSGMQSTVLVLAGASVHDIPSSKNVVLKLRNLIRLSAGFLHQLISYAGLEQHIILHLNCSILNCQIRQACELVDLKKAVPMSW